MYKELLSVLRIKVNLFLRWALWATGSVISQNDRADRTIIGRLECVSLETFSNENAYTALKPYIVLKGCKYVQFSIFSSSTLETVRGLREIDKSLFWYIFSLIFIPIFG